MQKTIALCLILVSNAAFAISSKLSDALNQGSQAINSIGTPKTIAQPDHSITVSGTISSPDGSTAKDFVVKAFAGKLNSSQLMGSALTDDGGAYTIAFPSNSATTIIVKVYCKSAQVAVSPPEYNVTEGAYIDVTVPSPHCSSDILSKPKIGFPIQKTGH